MNLTYFGHSCFLLTDEGGTRILTDPYGDIGYALPHIRCDAVTVSHGHYDHANVGAVDCGRVITGGSCTVGAISVTSAASFHDDAEGRKRGANTIFAFEADGVRVVHLGDLGEPVSEARLSSIGRADALLIPVGGRYTIDGETAAEYVRRLAPAVVIPMHYKTKDLQIDIASEEQFLRAAALPVRRIGSEYRIEKGNGREATQIIRMEKAI